ncbi:MAG: NADP-specific glutamate dehydrogenase [Pseudomonadota bacterium]
MTKTYDLNDFMNALEKRAPNQPEFLQAVEDVARDVIPVIDEYAEYQDVCILERLTEPDRQISFRVSWERDDGSIAVNRGYRVQFNSAIGPYKGGLRFHPSVKPSILKFLGFEQIYKNALTGLPMGGGKGGSDFDPSGCSDAEIERFCHAFMLELHRHIGPDRDIPAGDINVGAKEIGYLFGAYKRITGDFQGVLTGKGLSFGGSEMRVEATGYGLVYFLKHMLAERDDDLEGKRIAISGAGNVALHAAEKALDLGGKVITLSDSGGTLYHADGFHEDHIRDIRALKANGGSLEEYTDTLNSVDWRENEAPWRANAEIALPCATQNELDQDGAKHLVENGCIAIAEGANMPLTSEAKSIVRESDTLFAPAKAANAGGVAVSGLEISQNRQRRSFERRDVAEDLRAIMSGIHSKCLSEGMSEKNTIDYGRGANIAAFKIVADAMVAQGVS